MSLITKLAAPELASNGKWSAAFINWRHPINDVPYVASTCTSAPVFDTAADAEEGGKRALVVLEQTGKFPNMCEKF
jgi:hypothetical protein